tara:strand:- start:746 stop:1315 length:570 start_codon:yes stop_codon:yes gene_type:complete
MYKLFTDKSELFECTIALEGASLKKSNARLVIETNEYSLLFKGKIDANGNCKIPIKKLRGLIEENTKGTIRLEVIAENTFFTPWESNFQVDASKKVTVEVKSASTPHPIMEATVTSVKADQITLTERQHIINVFKLLVREDINISNIAYKRDALNNIVATYLNEHDVLNAEKVISGVLKVLETKSKKWL